MHAPLFVEILDAYLWHYEQGNDLVTPVPQYQFPGLKPGDRWCLCASRWLDAYKAGKAPLVVLESTNAKALRIVPLEALLERAISVAADA